MAIRTEFRKSQGVVPFGVGAVIDFSDESLMTAGLDMWPTERADAASRIALLEASRVVDGRLARRLTRELRKPIDYFLSPTEAPELGGFGARARADRAVMPFVRFPTWYFCPRCRVLKQLPWNTPSGSDSLKCTNMGRRTEGKGDPCGSLPKNRRPALSPVRFVVACSKGHISDFPWRQWAHSRSDRNCETAPGDLYLYSTPAAGLAGVVVGCTRCNATRSMAGAFGQDALREAFGGCCPGERPWLGPFSAEACTDEVPQTIQRGASNAYFARVVSSILIPPYSARIQQVLDRPDVWSEIKSSPFVDGAPWRPFLETKAKNLGLDPDAFVRAVHERLAKSDETNDELNGDLSEASYRYDEYKAYVGPRPPKEEREDFDTEIVSPARYSPWFNECFEQVVLVRKLRETRVLTGFSRLLPPDSSSSTSAALSLQPKRWLPGFAVRGEGIFLQLRRSALNVWKTIEIENRVLQLQQRSDQLRVERALASRPILPEFILIHTLAHLLIRQLAFECGYDSSSIRERLYVSNDPLTPMNGLLLYTASGDSEGTLGGLVRQGEPGRLDGTIRAAMLNATICSSDPLCIESNGQGTYGLNLASCHACGLLPETSCEESNLFLDRVLAIGTPENTGLGYFGKVSEMATRD